MVMPQAYYRFGEVIRDIVLRRFPIVRKLPSGLEVKIGSHSQYVIHADIFMDGEYDTAITTAIQRSGRIRFVDIGANAGYFAARVADMCIRASVPYEGICIEGSPSVHRILDRRITTCPELQPHVKSFLGLVGQRSGTGIMYESRSFDAMNTLVSSVHLKAHKERVPYLDLTTTVPWDRIDLLKCDIEGSEEAFVESYPELLAKTDTLVMEMHAQLVDVPACLKRISDAGLRHASRLRDSLPCHSIELFIR